MIKFWLNLNNNIECKNFIKPLIQTLHRTGTLCFVSLVVLLVMPGMGLQALQEVTATAIQPWDAPGPPYAPNATTSIFPRFSHLESNEAALGKQALSPFSVSRSRSFQNSPSCTANHIVRVGDSLSAIAQFYDVSLSAISDANGLGTSNTIYVGQILCLPGYQPQPTPTPAPVASAPVATSPTLLTPTQVSTGETYTVQPGDTLFAVSRTYGVTVSALQAINGIADPRALQVGQVLLIPGLGTGRSPTPAPVVVPTVTVPAPTANAFTVQFFNNTTLSGSPVLSKSDLYGWRYDWGLEAPAPGINSDFFSASWDGYFDFVDGVHRFIVAADDGTRLYIDGELVMDHWYEQAGYIHHSLYTTVTAGTHHVRLEYYEHGGNAFVRLRWHRALADGTTFEPELELVTYPEPPASLTSDLRGSLENSVFEAIQYLDVAALRSSLQSLPDLNFKNYRSMTPLQAAVMTDNAILIATVLEHPAANINERMYDDFHKTSGLTALHVAANFERLTAMRTLIQHGADLEIRDNEDYTPLLGAVRSLNADALDLLLATGANPNVQVGFPEKDAGNAPVHFAIRQYGDSRVLRSLMASSEVDPDIRNDEGFTALYLATQQDKAEKVRLLLEHPDINPNRVSKRGYAPLHFAAIYGFTDVAIALLSHPDIDPNIETKWGSTPLHYAEDSHVGVERALLDHPDIRR